MGFKPTYVYNRQGFLSLDVTKYNSILGLFAPDHMPYHLEGEASDPTLSEMTQKAIQLLSRKKDGFFLFVEGKLFDILYL